MHFYPSIQLRSSNTILSVRTNSVSVNSSHSVCNSVQQCRSIHSLNSVLIYSSHGACNSFILYNSITTCNYQSLQIFPSMSSPITRITRATGKNDKSGITRPRRADEFSRREGDRNSQATALWESGRGGE